MDGNIQNDAARIREFIEDVRAISERAKNTPGPSADGFELLDSGRQSRLLHRLSFLERWARRMRSNLTAQDSKSTDKLAAPTRKKGGANE